MKPLLASSTIYASYRKGQKIQENAIIYIKFKPKIKLIKNWFAGRVKTFQKNFSRRTTSSKIYLNFYFKITDQNYCKVVKAYEILLKVPITVASTEILFKIKNYQKLLLILHLFFVCFVLLFLLLFSIYFY